jgi:hypothetical protein
MLKTLREFASDFGSVKLTQGALTIEVTFKETETTAAPVRNTTRPPLDKKHPFLERLDMTRGKRVPKPAVAMLDETPPAFEFEVS